MALSCSPARRPASRPPAARDGRHSGPALACSENVPIRRGILSVTDGGVTGSRHGKQPEALALAPGLSFLAGEEPQRNFTGYTWPLSGTVLEERLVRDVARFARPMLWFLADRHDLGTILLQHGVDGGGFIRRGEVMGGRWGELAAGIAEAIVLARAIPDPGLENRAFAILDAGHASGRAVGRWAGLFQQWSPVDISDLERLGTYSSAAIRAEFARYLPANQPRQG